MLFISSILYDNHRERTEQNSEYTVSKPIKVMSFRYKDFLTQKEII